MKKGLGYWFHMTCEHAVLELDVRVELKAFPSHAAHVSFSQPSATCSSVRASTVDKVEPKEMSDDVVRFGASRTTIIHQNSS